MVPRLRRGRLHRGVAVASRAAPLVGTGTPRAGSSSRRWRRWNSRLAFLVFPRIASSSGIDRCKIGGFGMDSRPIGALPIAWQVRELQAPLSVNKSELARILRVSRPTVYDWLDGGEPNAGNRGRIWRLLRLVAEARVSAGNPLFPRFVRSALEPGDRSLLELLGEEANRRADCEGRDSEGEGVGGCDLGAAGGA